MVLVGPPDRPAVAREAGDSALETLVAEGERDRDGLERLAGLESEPPVVLGVSWAEKGQVGRPRAGPRVLANLPVPAAVVLDLPQQGMAALAVDNGAHGQVGA